MIWRRFFARKPAPAQALYDAIVASARQPAFYRDMGVSDTIDGRFDMLVLHLSLVIARLKSESPGLCQELVNIFCADMDGNVRELGASDIGVAKKVRQMAEAFQGRYEAYAAENGHDGMMKALQRNVYAGAAEAPGVSALADYVLATRKMLAATPAPVIADGKLPLL